MSGSIEKPLLYLFALDLVVRICRYEIVLKNQYIPFFIINFPPAGYKPSPLGGTALAAYSCENIASICGTLPAFFRG